MNKVKQREFNTFSSFSPLNSANFLIDKVRETFCRNETQAQLRSRLVIKNQLFVRVNLEIEVVFKARLRN